MNTLCCFPMLALCGLATYRLAMLLSDDLGPFGMFSKLRSFLKREAKTNKPLRASKAHIGIECRRCSSVWVAVPVAVFAYFHRQLPVWFAAAGDIFLGAMALSAIAILLSRLLPPK